MDDVVLIQNGLTRVHRSIVKEPFRFEALGAAEQLGQEFVLWLCHNLDRDIYGFIRIDIKKMAKDLGYSSSNHLQERVEVPHQFRNKTPEQIDEIVENPNKWVFGNKFENMLYMLSTINIDLLEKDDSLTTHFKYSLKPKKLVEEINVYVDKKNRDKRYYDVRPTDSFFELLSEAYLMMRFDKYITISRTSKKIKLGSLYMALVLLKNDQCLKGTGHRWSKGHFNDLTNKLGISHYKAQSKKKQKLGECLDIIKEIDPDLGLDHRFDYYTPLFKFANNIGRTKEANRKMKVFHFERILKYYFIDAYDKKHHAEDANGIDFNKEKFLAWFKSGETDVLIKTKAYCKAHFIYWKKKIEEDHNAVRFYIQYQKLLDNK